MSTLDPAARERVLAVIEALKHEAGPLLPVLHGIQNALGYVPSHAVPLVADALNLSRADVHGVVSFYHDFRDAPDPRPEVQLCRAEACQARGVEALVPAAQAAAGERVRLSAVYCLGLCAIGPNALVDGRPVARIDAATLDRIAAEVAA